MSSSLPIIASNRRFDLDAAAGQTVFTFPRPLFDALDLRVRRKVSPATTYETLLAGFTVTPAVDKATASVTFDVAPRPSVGDPVTSIRLEGRRTPRRSTDVTRGGAIASVLLETELDAFTTTAQELRRDVDETSENAAIATDAAARAEEAEANAQTWNPANYDTAAVAATKYYAKATVDTMVAARLKRFTGAAKVGNYTLVTGDDGAVIIANGLDSVITLPAAGTLFEGFTAEVVAGNTGVTLAGTIDGYTNPWMGSLGDRVLLTIASGAWVTVARAIKPVSAIVTASNAAYALKAGARVVEGEQWAAGGGCVSATQGSTTGYTACRAGMAGEGLAWAIDLPAGAAQTLGITIGAGGTGDGGDTIVTALAAAVSFTAKGGTGGALTSVNFTTYAPFSAAAPPTPVAPTVTAAVSWWRRLYGTIRGILDVRSATQGAVGAGGSTPHGMGGAGGSLTAAGALNANPGLGYGSGAGGSAVIGVASTGTGANGAPGLVLLTMRF